MSSISPISAEDLVKTAKKPEKNQPAVSEKDRLAVKKVAREFETLFVGMMLKSMRDTVGKDTLTGGGQGEDIYRSLLDQEYARAITETHGLGVAEMLEKELLKTVPRKEVNTADKEIPG